MDAAAFKQAIAATASSSGTGAHSHGAPPSLWCQFKALCIKRLHGMKRDRQLHVFQILIPVVFLSMAFLIGLAKAPHQPSIPLTSEMFLEGRRNSEILFAADSPMDVEIKSYLPAELAPVVTNTSRVGIKSQSTLQALLAEEYYTHGAGNGAFRRIAVASVTVPHYEQGIVQTVLSLNASAPHAAPMAQQLMHNAVLARHFANTTKFPLGPSGVVPQIVGHNHPLPTTEKSADQLISVNKIMNTLSIIIPYALLPAQYAIVCVRDREFKIAHREWVAGAGTLAYWLSAFVIDTLSFLFTATLTLILLTVFHVDKIKQHGFAVVGAPVSLIVLYGLAMVPASYTLSQLFTRHTVAQNAIMIGVFIVAYALVMGIQIVALMKETMDTAENIAKVLRVLPPYAFGEGMWAMTQAAMASLFTPAAVGGAPPVDYFGDVHFASNPDITGASFAGGAGTGLKYLAPSVVVQLLIFIATQVPIVRRGARTVGRAVTRVYNKALSVVTCGRCSRSRGGDAFTATTSQEEGLEAPLIAGTDKRNDGSYSPAEEVYGSGVNRGSLADEPIVCLDGITASYGVDAPAVRSVSLNAKFGRVLALMGLNGAGKSTLFSVLTGALPVDDGTVSINGEAINDSVVRADVGYCPQRDGLPQDLTPVEIMTLYCRLKGVDPASIDGLLDATGIAPWASSTIRTLSGGTRRRVSLALALIGDPAVLLLDEPTAGLDPTARRQLWETVRSASAGRCTVLTTHHAEEIDALALDGVVLDHGRVCMAGTIADLRQRSPVAHVINATFETAASAQNWKSRAVGESWASGVTIDCDASKCAVSVGHGTAVSVVLSSVNGAGNVRSVSVSKPSIDVVIPLRNAGAEATQ